MSSASEQQRLASNPRINAWVAANAGSGKTRVLVDRVIRLLLDGAKPQHILCLTFTKAAAAEMANRLFDRLGAWISLDDTALAEAIEELGVADIDARLLSRARRLFTLTLETPGGLKIQTIHAFAERLLQLFPIEAGIAPGFTVMDERQAGALLEAARRAVLSGSQTTVESAEARALIEIIPFVTEGSFDELIQSILSKRSDLSHVLSDGDGVASAIASLRAALGRPETLTEAEIADGLALDEQRYRALAETLRHGSDKDNERADLILAALARPDPRLDDVQSLLLTKELEAKKPSSVATKAVVAMAGWIPGFIAEDQERLKAAIAARADLKMLSATEALLTLAAAIVSCYESEKRRTGQYDFDDLIVRTRDLLTQASAAQWVLYKLDGGIDHILIDEAQDTSPAQWQIVESLAEEFFSGHGARPDLERTFFAVGDRKQSIFSFQGADPDAFVAAATRFEIKIAAGGKTFRLIPLHISYRSTKWVLEAVDCVFEQEAARRGIEARLDVRVEHSPHRSEAHGLVELWPLVGPDEKSEPVAWRAPVDTAPENHPRRKLATKIARRVASWMGRRWLASQKRTVRPGDILILVQRRNPFFDAVIRELRQHGVPVAGADRLKLSAHIAIRDVLALAQFTLLPEDDYTLACVLKSPLVSRDDGMPIDDADLFTLAYGRGAASLWDRLLASGDPRFATARAYLERWLTDGVALSPFAFFSRLLVESRAALLRRLGSEANDPLDALLDTALEFEQDHAPTLSAFIAWFAGANIEIKRDMDQGGDEVRVMTVHGAKGLESHIVILPDTVDLPDHRHRPDVIMVRPEPDRADIPFWVLSKMPRSATVQAWCDEKLDSAGDEYRRLLYVAMTRARDELYICGCYNQTKSKPECWYELVKAAITKRASEIPDSDGGTVWRMGSADSWADTPSVAEAAPAWLPEWLKTPLPPVPARAAPSRFSERPQTPISARREMRMARGRLFHTLLQRLPQVPPEARSAMAALIAKRAGFDEKIAASALEFVEDSRYAVFFASAGLAEVPVVMKGADGRMITGQIDRLLVTDDEVLILDYKTDEKPPSEPETVDPIYLSQLAGYRAAIQLVFPRHRIRAALLWTEIPSLMELPEALLDRAAMQETPDLAASPEP
ncbi:MAG: double-strand break repair helicase AddA [Rhizobiales bacterium]|nr:double-strand break repair helicase AddA [Hyphomicrobiales bacterium]